MHPEYDHLMESATEDVAVFFGPKQMPEESHGVCQVCGKNWGRTHSGTIECGSCWDWRKLGRPAAKYWLEAIDHLFSNENGAVDANDSMIWGRMGVAEEANKALEFIGVTLHDKYMEEMHKHNNHSHDNVCVFLRWNKSEESDEVA